MIRFNWMWRYNKPMDQADLIEISDELDSVGYYSMLLTVHSRSSDYLPIVSSVLDRGHKLKYILAIRPYLLSPQYLMMLLAGMEEIAKDRIMLNWVHGTLGPNENFNAVLSLPGDMNDPEVRRQHMSDFLEALDKTNMHQDVKVPESMMSGGNPNTVELVKKFGMHLGSGYDIFINNYDSYRKYKFPKIFVQVSLLIRDTDEEALAIKNERVLENINVIAGSKETIEKKILELHSMGATDLLVSNAFGERGEERQRIHELVASMKGRGLAI